METVILHVKSVMMIVKIVAFHVLADYSFFRKIPPVKTVIKKMVILSIKILLRINKNAENATLHAKNVPMNYLHHAKYALLVIITLTNKHIYANYV